MPATTTLFLRRLARLSAPASLPPACPACQDSGRVPDPEGGPLAVLCPACRPSCPACWHELCGGECFNCGFAPEDER